MRTRGDDAGNGHGRALAAHTTRPVAITSGPRHVVQYANAAFCQMLDREPAALLDHPFAEVVPLSDRPSQQALLDRAYYERLALPLREQQPHPWRCLAWPLLNQAGVATGLVLQGSESAEESSPGDVVAAPATMVQSAPDFIMILEADGTLRYANRALMQMLGYQAQEWYGKTYLEFVTPTDRERARQTFTRCLEQPGIEPPVELQLRHADGTSRDVVLIASNQMSEPGISGLVFRAWQTSDSTQRWRVEHELRQREARFRAFFQWAGVGIMLIDRNDCVVESNPALRRLLGYSESELRGMRITSFTHPDDVPRTFPSFQELLAGNVSSYVAEKRVIGKDGRIVWIHQIVSRLPDSGPDLPVAIALVEDITDRKQIERDLLVAQRQLAGSRDAERLRLARDLHDGPLQDLFSISYELADAERAAADSASTVLIPKLVATRERVLDVAAQLRGLIGELRPPGLVEFGLPTALETHIEKLRRNTPGALPTIVLDYGRPWQLAPAPVETAAFRIVQEGLQNALRHAQAKQITVRLRRESGHLSIQIHDDGRGFLPPDGLSDLIQESKFGLGGMAERVALLDGHLTIDSQPGAGTTISAEIPFQERE